MHDLNGAKNGLIEHHIKYNRYHKYNRTGIIMNTIHKMSIYVVLIAILALVPNVSATGYMDGNNWTGIDNILDSYGFSYLKNNSGMSNPATADLDMGNYNITGLVANESYSYLIWTDGTTTYAKNGSTGKVDYSGTNASMVINNSLIIGRSIKMSCGMFNITSTIRIPSNTLFAGSGACTILLAASDINMIENNNLLGDKNITITDFSIIGNLSHNNSRAIRAGHLEYSTIKNLYIYSFSTGHIYIGSSDFLLVENIFIDGIDNTRAAHGIYWDDCDHCRIFNNEITRTHFGIYMRGSNDGEIESNHISHTNGTGIEIAVNSQRIIVTGNSITAAGENGIQIVQSAQNIVSGNRVFQSTLFGLWIRNSATIIPEGNVISNNIFSKSGRDGIAIAGQSNNVINSNLLVINGQTGGEYGGISITTDTGGQQSNNNTITGNLCYDNQAVPTQSWGIIEINTDYNTIVGNNCWGNKVSQIHVNSSNTKHTGNIGINDKYDLFINNKNLTNYFTFDEGISNLTHDATGSWVGTIVSPNWVKGTVGNAVLINSTTSYVSLSNFGSISGSILNTTKTFTVSSVITPNNISETRIFIGFSNGSNNRFYLATIDGYIGCGYYNGSSYSPVSSNYVLKNGVPVSVICTHFSDGKNKLYINGIEHTGIQSTTQSNAVERFRFGANTADTPGISNVSIDYVKFWIGDLSAKEIQAEAIGGKTETPIKFNCINNLCNFGRMAAAPTTYNSGDTYFDSTSKKDYTYDGTRWITGYGEGGFTFTNGSSDISAGTKNKKRMLSSGILTAVYLDSEETGTMNVSISNATITYGYVNITSGIAGSSTGLNYVYQFGDLLNFSVISNTGIHQVGVAVAYTKTS